jgi:hypothetical protein
MEQILDFTIRHFSKCWNIGTSKHRNIEMLGYWNIGTINGLFVQFVEYRNKYINK